MESQSYPKKAEKPETESTSPVPPPLTTESPPPPPPPPPRPCLSSSPSHEFSFTISLHAPNSISGTNTAGGGGKLSNSSSSCLNFDLSPADDIFFNGRLLPLHFVAHRLSDSSIQSTNFPPLSPIETLEANYTTAGGAGTGAFAAVPTSVHSGRRSAPIAFPFYWLRKRLRKKDGEENRLDEKQRKKKLLDFALLWKKYTSLVEQFLLLKDWREKREIRRSTQFSFHGEGRQRGWQEGLSAPASIRTSPANSSLLVTPSTTNFSSEELNNAIQAAIVHCKNSTGV
ncbi:BRI1 kinase inhibitor 1-like [Phalaenopsis equestris]|uniref:BRI1 kinase inhibitor 1-like n=1 Tax=Phalaenopsis equestris TaxID=78828 RepID=UPI0009E5C05C|nr:BRI1 kinase inhibitor 1-like [Phalaenopsis equestris]